MELGIKGHPTRGDEVVKILEMLGGNNCYNLTGIYDNKFYYIRKKFKNITNSYIGPDEIKGYEIFSLEDFLEKFPYKVGDKVNVWINYDYFGRRVELEDAEIKSMRWNSVRCEIAYKMKDITREFYKDDIKGKVNDDDEEQQIDPSIDYYKVVENELYEDIEKRKIEITMDTLFRAGITLEHLKECGCELPDGYHFTDENGNVIDTTKIRLVKNTPSYPKTYKECCELLGCKSIIGFAGLDDEEENLYGKFIALKRCRDAYWKIAGEELGLGRPWKPNFNNNSPKHNILNSRNRVMINDNKHDNRILTFPTIEMRNAFLDNFRDLIEQCKELL